MRASLALNCTVTTIRLTPEQTTSTGPAQVIKSRNTNAARYRRAGSKSKLATPKSVSDHRLHLEEDAAKTSSRGFGPIRPEKPTLTTTAAAPRSANVSERIAHARRAYAYSPRSASSPLHRRQRLQYGRRLIALRCQRKCPPWLKRSTRSKTSTLPIFAKSAEYEMRAPHRSPRSGGRIGPGDAPLDHSRRHTRSSFERKGPHTAISRSRTAPVHVSTAGAMKFFARSPNS